MNLKTHSFEILNALSNPILAIDPNYCIIFANKAACASFCLPLNNIVDHNCFQITHKLDRPCWHEGSSCPVKTAIELKEQTRVLHEHNYSGKAVFEEIRAYPVLDDQGDVDFIVEELNDITELIQSKEITKHLKKDINTLHGLLPICSQCKNIRDEKGYWTQIESYISRHSDAQFSHSLCESCNDELYGDDEWYMKMEKKRKDKVKDT